MPLSMKILLKQESVQIPDGVKASIDKKILTLQTSTNTRILDLSHFNLTFTVSDSIQVSLWNGNRLERSKVNTAASIIRNAVNGIAHKFLFIVKAASVHFPISLEIDKNKVIVKNFIGEKNTRTYEMRGETVVRLGEEKNTLELEGISLEDVSQSAAILVNDLKCKRYDTRKFLDGVYVVKKGLKTEH